MRIRVFFNEVESFKVQFVQDTCTFKPSFGEIVTLETTNIYQGIYNVIPRIYGQTLATKDKMMKDNVTIESIPIAQTINLKNGYTVTIG